MEKKTVSLTSGAGKTGLLLLLLSRFSHVQLCATPETAAPPGSLGFPGKTGQPLVKE